MTETHTHERKRFGLLNLGKLKTRSESVKELAVRSELVRTKGSGLPPPSPPLSTGRVEINAFSTRQDSSTPSEISDGPSSIDMERAFSDSVVLKGNVFEQLSQDELLLQLKQLTAVNAMLMEQLNSCERQLELYKDRLMQVNRRNPVMATRTPADGTTPEASSRNGSMQTSGNNSRSVTPQLAGADVTAPESVVDTAALRLALDASKVVVMPSSTLSLHKTLGNGCFGETVLGRFDGITCAVKKLHINKPNVETQFVREVEAFQTVRHPHVLSLWGAVIEPDACWLVTEYMPNGTLNDALRRSFSLKSKPMSTKLQILWDVASGMAAMERIGVLHRDLKPSNVLLDSDMRAKVADLGLARIVNDEHVALTAETGTYIYMAPEVMNWEEYGSAADVWSWACTACEVLSAEFPYQRRLLTPLQIAKEVMECKMRPDLPECASAQMKELLLRCLAFNPTERPTFAEITKVMEILFAEQKAKEGVENGLKRSSSWKNFFGRESGSGRLGRLSTASSLSAPSPGPLSIHYEI